MMARHLHPPAAAAHGFSWGRFQPDDAHVDRLFRRDHRGRTCAEIRRFFPEQPAWKSPAAFGARVVLRERVDRLFFEVEASPREPATDLIPRTAFG